MRQHPPVGPDDVLGESHRDPPRVVRFALSVRDWIADTPNVLDARPPIPPCCHFASSLPGGRLVLHGHGCRTRTVRGILTNDETPTLQELLARRYLFATCGVTSTVVPADVLPRKHFGVVTIARAFAVDGAIRQSLDAVYRSLNPARVRGLRCARLVLDAPLALRRPDVLPQRAPVALRVLLAPLRRAHCHDPRGPRRRRVAPDSSARRPRRLPPALMPIALF